MNEVRWKFQPDWSRDKKVRDFKGSSAYAYTYNNIILIFRQSDFPIVNMNVIRTVLDLGLERNQHVQVSSISWYILAVRLHKSRAILT